MREVLGSVALSFCETCENQQLRSRKAIRESNHSQLSTNSWTMYNCWRRVLFRFLIICVQFFPFWNLQMLHQEPQNKNEQRCVVVIEGSSKKEHWITEESWDSGLVVWFSLRVREVPGSIPGCPLFWNLWNLTILGYQKSRALGNRHWTSFKINVEMILKKEMSRHFGSLQTSQQEVRDTTKNWQTVFTTAESSSATVTG